MKSTLENRILIFAFMVLTLTIAVNTGVNIEGFRRDYRDGIIRRAQSFGTEVKGSIEKVLALGIPLEEMEGLGNRCQEVTETDPEIVYCLIENSSGEPLYSSSPSADFLRGVEFVSPLNENTVILRFSRWGKVYDSFEPIYGPGGKLAGRIRIGFPDSVLIERTGTALERSLLILAGAFVLVFVLVALFAKRHVVLPIRRLRSIASEIAAGNFSVEVPSSTTRELAELGQALKEMAASLHDREEKIQLGYRELEDANLHLLKSYEDQEKIGAELVRSREMYRSLLEDASDAIIVSDHQDRIVLINKAAESFFGIARKKIEGANIFAFLEKLQVEEIEHQYEVHQAILQGQTLETEMRFTRPTDKSSIIAWAKASPVLGKDSRRMVQAIYRDVTREREIKANLEKSTLELQRLNQMKDSFLGLASHELKTPLTVIIGYSDLLLGEMSANIDPATRPLVQHIGDAAARLANIVRDMVDVSMLDNRAMRLRYRHGDINEIIRQAVQEIDFFFSVRKQSLSLNLAEELPAVPFDADRMVQAITNLVINAIKFTPDGGTITIETRLVNILRPPRVMVGDELRGYKEIAPETSPYAEICIRDTGIGIAEIDQIHIFDKFYEVGNIEEHFTGKMAFKGKGAGLGLTIVKGIVDTHGGEIWVESRGYNPKTNPGSEFHLLLPLVAANPQWVRAALDEEEFHLPD
ncbi:PAS domain-containing sensor histidine kinase [Desulfuromonas versatilis]|uniref:histidine kinase n=1 Tax=Desulfuromonas versatilis TaxID=2802975 RepID=A0ABM8HUW5_9BACT|nr:ATP-binding protein [Desulfuromonas versatilis]BCR04862.1 PAS domain-containing sensor histidine kinase [Desulfuromonas versatilis]